MNRLGELVFVADANGWGHMGGWGWGAMIFGWIFMVAVIALIFWAVWATTRTRHPSAGRGSRAAEILDERYARGELNRDEYLERRADLE